MEVWVTENLANMERRIRENLANTKSQATENLANKESRVVENSVNTKNRVIQDSGGKKLEEGKGAAPSKRPAPRWCLRGITKTQKHRLQKMRPRELAKKKEEEERDYWFNRLWPMTKPKQTWREKWLAKEENLANKESRVAENSVNMENRVIQDSGGKKPEEGKGVAPSKGQLHGGA
jgi:hypothetical protein